MLRYFEPRDRFIASSSTSSEVSSSNDIPLEWNHWSQMLNHHFNLEMSLSAPYKRTQILDYHPNDQDEVRRAYLAKEPTQPKLGTYPTKVIGGKNRSFVEAWYDEFDWLEYNVERNAIYCLSCYLFYNGSSRSAFVKEGFQC
ncbi:hypothetical protein LIER_05860 [Lithospermum erythrorhizon]|uniref:TTF-type domain-containing protein n=1 Tax=Lithospermum erythrorhizon TaxID=34254 RepID=A0AAV3P3W9_LITER